MSDSPIDDASLWQAGEFADPSSYVAVLDERMQAELEAAVRRAEANGASFEQLSPARLALPAMGGLLEEALAVLEDGRGFIVLRGVPVARLSEEGLKLALAGLCVHLGELVCQSVHRNKLEEITDRGQALDHTARGYQDTRALPFHTDGSDYAGLLCVEAAAAGGESLLASAAALYDTVRHEQPRWLPILERGLYHHRRGEQPPGEPPVLPARQPVFRIEGGRMHAFYNRNPVAWLAREGIELSEEEIAAQDCLDEVLTRPSLVLRMRLEPGDLQLINNYTILHSRSAYQDSPERKRRLLRVWIRSRAPRRHGPNIIDVYAPWESRARPAT